MCFKFIILKNTFRYNFLRSCHFAVAPPKSLKLSIMFSFYYSFLEQVMLTLLLLLSAYYSSDRCKNRWNETAGLTALLYPTFSELKQLCSYLHSCEFHDFDIFIFFINSHQKPYFFRFSKELLFPTGQLHEDESWYVFRHLSRLSKNVVS